MTSCLAKQATLTLTPAAPLSLGWPFRPRRQGRHFKVSQARSRADAASSTTHVLVTANRVRLAAVLEKGLQRQGWTTCIATTPQAVLTALQQIPTDLVLLDADYFQADTTALVNAIDQRRSQVILLAADYRLGNQDLRHLVAPDDIVIKPFSTQHLMATLRSKRA